MSRVGKELGLSLILLPALADSPRVISGTPAPHGDEYTPLVLFLVAGWGRGGGQRSGNVILDPLMWGCSVVPPALGALTMSPHPFHVPELFWLSVISCVYWQSGKETKLEGPQGLLKGFWSPQSVCRPDGRGRQSSAGYEGLCCGTGEGRGGGGNLEESGRCR